MRGVHVVRATYGGNCRVPSGNATYAVAQACEGRSRCEYVVDYKVIGDPSYGCRKDFVAEWQCVGDERLHRQLVPGEAGYRSTVHLTCEVPPGTGVVYDDAG
jgi:hypothetical protein